GLQQPRQRVLQARRPRPGRGRLSRGAPSRPAPRRGETKPRRGSRRSREGPGRRVAGHAPVSGRALLVALIPCYNPGPALAAVVATASKHVEALVVVDDGSEQGLEEALGATPVTRLRFERNRGKGHALVAGLRLCLAQFPCDAVVMLDADGQHDADEIPALRRVWAQSRADLVIGVRTGDWTRVAVSRRWGNRVGSRVLSRG